MRTKRMILPASILVSAAGLFRCVKQTQTNGIVVDFNFRQPTLVFGAHTRVPAFVVAAFVAVMRIFGVGRFAQITKAIIRSISVNMVDLMRWPSARHVEPRQPMREIKHIIKTDYGIAVFHSTTRFSSRRTSPPLGAPSKQPCFRVVIDKMANARSRKFVLHGTININHWRECQA